MSREGAFTGPGFAAISNQPLVARSPSLVTETSTLKPTKSSNVWMIGQQYLLSVLEQL